MPISITENSTKDTGVFALMSRFGAHSLSIKPALLAGLLTFASVEKSAAQITIDPTLAPPVNVQLDAIGFSATNNTYVPDEVSLKWLPGANDNLSYQIFIADTPGGFSTNVNPSLGGTAVGATDGGFVGLAPGTHYLAVSATELDGGRSPFSPPQGIKVVLQKPSFTPSPQAQTWSASFFSTTGNQLNVGSLRLVTSGNRFVATVDVNNRISTVRGTIDIYGNIDMGGGNVSINGRIDQANNFFEGTVAGNGFSSSFSGNGGPAASLVPSSGLNSSSYNINLSGTYHTGQGYAHIAVVNGNAVFNGQFPDGVPFTAKAPITGGAASASVYLGGRQESVVIDVVFNQNGFVTGDYLWSRWAIGQTNNLVSGSVTGAAYNPSTPGFGEILGYPAGVLITAYDRIIPPATNIFTLNQATGAAAMSYGSAALHINPRTGVFTASSQAILDGRPVRRIIGSGVILQYPGNGLEDVGLGVDRLVTGNQVPLVAGGIGIYYSLPYLPTAPSISRYLGNPEVAQQVAAGVAKVLAKHPKLAAGVTSAEFGFDEIPLPGWFGQ